jgi:c-di-GMP-binding flagellar brake protein YcgR
MPPPPGKALKPRAERRQRRHPRYRVDFPVTVILLSEGEHRSIDAHCRDLSVAGIGMLIAAELNLGEVAALNFSLPGSPREWGLRAVLRQRRGYHYGFEFLSVKPEDADSLAAFVSKLEPQDHQFGLWTRQDEA